MDKVPPHYCTTNRSLDVFASQLTSPSDHTVSNSEHFSRPELSTSQNYIALPAVLDSASQYTGSASSKTKGQ